MGSTSRWMQCPGSPPSAGLRQRQLANRCSASTAGTLVLGCAESGLPSVECGSHIETDSDTSPDDASGTGPGTTGMTGSAGTERDDSALRIVRRDSHGDSVTWYDFDAKAAHPAAQLGEYFLTRFYLYPIKAATMNGHDRALHVNQIILAQAYSSAESMPDAPPKGKLEAKSHPHSPLTASSTCLASAA